MLSPCCQLQGEIPELLHPNTEFDMVLANALYFKGLWKKAFNKQYAGFRV